MEEDEDFLDGDQNGGEKALSGFVVSKRGRKKGRKNKTTKNDKIANLDVKPNISGKKRGRPPKDPNLTNLSPYQKKKKQKLLENDPNGDEKNLDLFLMNQQEDYMGTGVLFGQNQFEQENVIIHQFPKNANYVNFKNHLIKGIFESYAQLDDNRQVSIEDSLNENFIQLFHSNRKVFENADEETKSTMILKNNLISKRDIIFKTLFKVFGHLWNETFIKNLEFQLFTRFFQRDMKTYYDQVRFLIRFSKFIESKFKKYDSYTPSLIATLDIESLFELKTNHIPLNVKNNEIERATHLFQSKHKNESCPSCSSKNTCFQEKQTRRADEGGTFFHFCLDCETQWKRS